MSQSVKTVCPYCGVGCGLEVTLRSDGVVSVAGDKTHPANYGRLCSKGAALGETLSLDDRLLYPEINGERVDWDRALSKVARDFSDTIAQYGPDSVAFYVSGQLLTEDYYVANKLMKGFIGSANIDTNSRLCMASSVVGHKRAFGSDTVPCSYEDLERASLVVLTGSNAAWCHPVLYQRLVKAKKNNPSLKVVVIDPRRTASCDIADLHLPIKPGSDVALFNGLLLYLDEQGERNELFVEHSTQGVNEALAKAREACSDVAELAMNCEVSYEDLQRFFAWYAGNEKVVTVYSQGVNQSSSGTDKVNAIINCHLLTGRIGRPGMGPFSFTGQTNAMGGREVGGLANQLAAHMDIDNADHRHLVQTFWSSPVIADQQGLKAMDLFRAVDEGKVKAIWIMCTNPVVSVANADLVKQALEKCEHVVVSDCVRHTDTTATAEVLLPATTWGEKSGTVTNSERRISQTRAFLDAPGESKADWWIISEVAKKMGFASSFNYKGPHEIFREHAALSGFKNNGVRDFDISLLEDITEDAYANLAPFQWPLNADNPDGKSRMFGNGRFYTPTGKARFVAVEARQPENAIDDAFPYILNTGRSRDQWHTMTRSGKVARLTEHAPEPYVEVHPDDAKDLGIKDTELARITSKWGQVIVRVRVTDYQKTGSVFVPMHWNNQFSACARIDAVVNPATDPFSGQPEFKHTPVKLEAYRPAWHGFLLSRRDIHLRDSSYWTRAAGDAFVRYEIAGDMSPIDLPAWSRSMLCANDCDVNWVELLDAKAGHYRGVRLVDGRIESCIFIAPENKLPSRSWLGSLFGKETLDDIERSRLLAATPMDKGEDKGKLVCSCFGVGVKQIEAAMMSGQVTNVDEIGRLLKAGTNCGSCVPEIKELLRNSTTQTA